LGSGRQQNYTKINRRESVQSASLCDGSVDRAMTGNFGEGAVGVRRSSCDARENLPPSLKTCALLFTTSIHHLHQQPLHSTLYPPKKPTRCLPLLEPRPRMSSKSLSRGQNGLRGNMARGRKLTIIAASPRRSSWACPASLLTS
jgi:hypothetical protein